MSQNIIDECSMLVMLLLICSSVNNPLWYELNRYGAE